MKHSNQKKLMFKIFYLLFVLWNNYFILLIYDNFLCNFAFLRYLLTLDWCIWGGWCFHVRGIVSFGTSLGNGICRVTSSTINVKNQEIFSYLPNPEAKDHLSLLLLSLITSTFSLLFEFPLANPQLLQSWPIQVQEEYNH